MSRTQTQRFFVGVTTIAWALAFVGAFLLGAIAVFGVTERLAPDTALWVFSLGHLLALVFAVSGAVIAWGTHSQSVRRTANVPLMGSGLMAFATVSFGALMVVMS